MADPEAMKEVVNAVKESLIRDGHINKIKGELRTAVMSVLNKNVERQNHDVPVLPEEARIVTDLIKEFFQWIGFRHSEQVLTADIFIVGETSHQSFEGFQRQSGREEKLSRKELEKRLNIESTDPIISKMPLLYLIVLAHIHKST